MTLPASGTISFLNFQTETGDTGDISLDWIRTNTKTGQASNSLNGYYSKAWYQRNVDGNCDNGNCTNCASNCGDTNCVNCYAMQCVNCLNCDARSWIQNNCNCRSVSYNCVLNAVSYNCACAPQCDCMYTCFIAGTQVLLFDGSTKSVEELSYLDTLMGADGLPVKLKALESPVLGTRRLLTFVEDQSLVFSEEHLFWAQENTKQWWWCPNPDVWREEVNSGAVVGLKDNYSHFTGNTVQIANIDGFLQRTLLDITASSKGPNTKLFMPVTVTGVPIIVNGYVATAGTNEFVYDYTKLDWNTGRTIINNLHKGIK